MKQKFKIGDRVYCRGMVEYGYGTIIRIDHFIDVSIDKIPDGIPANDGDVFVFRHDQIVPACDPDFQDKINDRMIWNQNLK